MKSRAQALRRATWREHFLAIAREVEGPASSDPAAHEALRVMKGAGLVVKARFAALPLARRVRAAAAV